MEAKAIKDDSICTEYEPESGSKGEKIWLPDRDSNPN